MPLKKQSKLKKKSIKKKRSIQKQKRMSILKWGGAPKMLERSVCGATKEEIAKWKKAYEAQKPPVPPRRPSPPPSPQPLPVSFFPTIYDSKSKSAKVVKPTLAPPPSPRMPPPNKPLPPIPTKMRMAPPPPPMRMAPPPPMKMAPQPKMNIKKPIASELVEQMKKLKKSPTKETLNKKTPLQKSADKHREPDLKEFIMKRRQNLKESVKDKSENDW